MATIDVVDDRLPAPALWAFAGLCVISGANIVAVRFSNAELAPLWGATLRFGGAAVLLAAIAFARRSRWPSGPQAMGAVLFGVVGFAASYGFVYWALVDAPAAFAAIVLSLVPLLTLILAIGFRMETFRARSLAGSLVAVGGIALLVSASVHLQVPLGSVLLLLVAASCMAGSNLVAKKFAGGELVPTLALAMGAGAALLYVASRWAGEVRLLPVHSATWWTLAYLIAIGSVAMFAFYLYVVRRASPTVVSYQFVVQPVVTILLAATIAHEPITWRLMVGGLLAGVGVYLGALSGSRRKPIAAATAA